MCFLWLSEVCLVFLPLCKLGSAHGESLAVTNLPGGWTDSELAVVG